MIGIGIPSWNGLAGVKRVIDGIRRYTRQPYRLVVSDDGSTDGTAGWLMDQGVTVIVGPRRGCAYNTNRIYHYLQQFSDVETFIVLEQDTIPVVEGWDVRWTETAHRMGHVVYSWTECDSPDVTPNDPPWCTGYGAQCVATRRDVFERFGYYDPRFYSVNYSSAHGEWSYRIAREIGFPTIPGAQLLPGMKDGLELIHVGTGWNQTDRDRSFVIQDAIYASNPPPYRGAWWNDAEKKAFDLDCQPAIPTRQIHEWVAAGQIHAHQNLHEFRDWLNMLRKIAPQVVIEIGTFKFGTAELMLHACPSIETLVTVDVEDRAAERPDVLVRHSGRLKFLRANSRDPETFRRISLSINSQADAAFIDGDHSLIGVWNDFVRTLPIVRAGGLIGFHDVFPFCEGNRDTADFFSGLNRRYPGQCQEIDTTAEGGPWEHYGIGVYRVE